MVLVGDAEEVCSETWLDVFFFDRGSMKVGWQRMRFKSLFEVADGFGCGRGRELSLRKKAWFVSKAGGQVSMSVGVGCCCW